MPTATAMPIVLVLDLFYCMDISEAATELKQWAVIHFVLAVFSQCSIVL